MDIVPLFNNQTKKVSLSKGGVPLTKQTAQLKSQVARYPSGALRIKDQQHGNDNAGTERK